MTITPYVSSRASDRAAREAFDLTPANPNKLIPLCRCTRLRVTEGKLILKSYEELTCINPTLEP